MLQDFYHLKRDNNPLREEAFTLSCLGKIYPASSSDFFKFRKYLSALLDEVLSFKDDSFTMKMHSGFHDSVWPQKKRLSRFISDATVPDTSIAPDASIIPQTPIIPEVSAIPKIPVFDNNDDILVIGLTESGIIPALLMYLETLGRNIDARILYSTRRPLSGIAFKEKHSHGPDHVLPLPDCKISQIWIVEDEITSGNTVLNLMIRLCQYLDIERVRVFAFADFRDDRQKSDFALNAAMHNIECAVHTLDIANYFIAQEFQSSNNCGKSACSPVAVRGSQSTNNCSKAVYSPATVPVQESRFTQKRSKIASVPRQMKFAEDRTDDRQSKVNDTHLSVNNVNNMESSRETDSLKSWHLPEKRPALAMKSGNFLDSDLWKLSTDSQGRTEIRSSGSVRYSEPLTKGTILAVGEAVDLAACFALANDNIRFQQISLSPWKVDYKSIFSRISFAGKYYLYNYEKLRDPLLHPVFILCDPIDRHIEQEAIIKLGECGIDIKPILTSGGSVESELFQISQ
ncbi:MAG: phosphoribosyltransferase domain-containing protein [Desulfamplus sp.]|nr:phosphoribosyltransferase domain-containing protein [Desulfamplus sp.]